MEKENKTEEKKEVKKESKKGGNKILLVIGAIVVVLIALNASRLKNDETSQTGVLGIEEAKTKALDFIKTNLVQSGTEVSVTDTVEENGLYKFNLDVAGQEVNAYMTQDGKKFFPQAINMEEVEQKAAEAKAAQEEVENSIPKADKPVVDLYVMSFCPYGNKAEDTLKPVYELLKDKVDFDFHYIVNSDENGKIQSLHGQPEVDQNIREVCVLNNYGQGAWINFVGYVNTNCGSDGSCWEKGAQSLNLSTAKINACIASQGTALMQAEEKASTEAGATGSPTMLINGSKTNKVYEYGNSEAYKQAICNAFNEQPSECSQTLNSETDMEQGGSC